jgi:hypothetical protein
MNVKIEGHACELQGNTSGIKRTSFLHCRGHALWNQVLSHESLRVELQGVFCGLARMRRIVHDSVCGQDALGGKH